MVSLRGRGVNQAGRAPRNLSGSQHPRTLAGRALHAPARDRANRPAAATTRAMAAVRFETARLTRAPLVGRQGIATAAIHRGKKRHAQKHTGGLGAATGTWNRPIELSHRPRRLERSTRRATILINRHSHSKRPSALLHHTLGRPHGNWHYLMHKPGGASDASSPQARNAHGLR